MNDVTEMPGDGGMTITFPLAAFKKILEKESGKDYTDGPVFGKWSVEPDGTLVEIRFSNWDEHDVPVEEKRIELINGTIKNAGEKAVKDDIPFNAWLVNRIGGEIKGIMDATRNLGSVEDHLRAIDAELRGKLRATFWCCMNPDIEITIDPMKTGTDGVVANRGVYNNYKCKTCGKSWIEMVSPMVGGYASVSQIVQKEIEDYHHGYIKELKMRCPACHSAHFHVVIVNEDKKTHHYEIWCSNCNTTCGPFPHEMGRLEKPVKNVPPEPS